MSNDLWVRIRSRNESAEAFTQVAKDANTAASAVESASTRASTALTRQSGALQVVGKSSAMAAMQQKNLLFQLNDIGVSLAGGANPLLVAAQQGGQLATIYGPEEGGLGKALKETANLALGLVTKFWPIAALVAGGTAAIAGMQHEINKTGEAQVSFGDVAQATWEHFTGQIYDLVQPAIGAVAGWLGDMWDMAAPYVKAAGNGIIGTFIGAFDAAKITWSVFPQVMGDITISTVNNVIGGVQQMLNSAIGLINDFKKSAGLDLPDIGAVQFGGLDNPYQGAMQGLAENIVGSFGSAFGTDYLGSQFDAIAKGARQLADARKEIDDTSSSMHGLGKSVGDAATDVTTGLDGAKGSFTDFASEASGLLGQIFEGNKTAAIAGAVLDASAGIAKTLSAYPFPFNIGMAALHGAAAIAQINKIKSTSKTSTSVDASVGGGSVAPVAAAPAAAGMGQGVNITLQGGFFSGQQVMGLLNQIQSALGMQGKQIAVNYINGA